MPGRSSAATSARCALKTSASWAWVIGMRAGVKSLSFMTQKSFPPEPRCIDLYDHFRAAVPIDIADATDRPPFGRPEQSKSACRASPVGDRCRPTSRGWSRISSPRSHCRPIRRIDLDHDLGPAVAVDVADADRSAGVRQARTVEIRLQRVTRDRRQVPPATRGGVEFHHPEIVAARMRRIDLNNDLGPAVTVDVADADRSTGVRQTGAVEIRLQRMTRDWRQMLPVRLAAGSNFITQKSLPPECAASI